MDESAEFVATADGWSCCLRLCWVAAVRREKVERAVWPVLVVVAAVDAEDVLEVAVPEDEGLRAVAYAAERQRCSAHDCIGRDWNIDGFTRDRVAIQVAKKHGRELLPFPGLAQA
jgi:hypothetical protein